MPGALEAHLAGVAESNPALKPVLNDYTLANDLEDLSRLPALATDLVNHRLEPCLSAFGFIPTYPTTLFASSCDNLRPIIAFGTRHLRSSSWPSASWP
jgi:hypothetical protein